MSSNQIEGIIITMVNTLRKNHSLTIIPFPLECATIHCIKTIFKKFLISDKDIGVKLFPKKKRYNTT